MGRWLRGRRGDMVEGALTLPLMALVALALVNLALVGFASVTANYAAGYGARVGAVAQADPADAAAEAAALEVDELHFIATGEVRLDAARYPGAAAQSFQATVANLLDHGYEATLDSLTVDEATDAVTTSASGTIRLIFGISPAFRVHTRATSWYRMVKR